MDEKQLTPEEEGILSVADLADVEPEEVAYAGKEESESESEGVCMTDPKWSEYVMREFEEDELDPNGRPFVRGLRRVARKVLGPILESRAKVIQPPQLSTGEKTALMHPATVEYTVKFLWCRLEPGMDSAYQVYFTDCADVYFGNTDPDFARHASATAATRAEARCLRKALQLKGIAAEESTLVPLEESSPTGGITPTQVTFVDILCQRNDINVLKYIGSGKHKFEKITDVKFSVAQQMMEHLSGLQNDRTKIKPEWKGYDPNWRKQ